MNFHRQISFPSRIKIETYIYNNDVVACASGGSVATDTGPGPLSPGAAAARTLGVKIWDAGRIPRLRGISGIRTGSKHTQGNPQDRPPARDNAHPGDGEEWCSREPPIHNLRDISSPCHLRTGRRLWAPWTWFILSSSRRCWSSPVVLPLDSNSVSQQVTSYRLAIQRESQPPPHLIVPYFRSFSWGDWGSLHGVPRGDRPCFRRSVPSGNSSAG